MELEIKDRRDRVREHTSDVLNAQIDHNTIESINYYSKQDNATIRKRIEELDSEWDVERVLETNAALIALSGVILGVTVNKKWLILPGIVTAFLAQHAVQGWCPPLPLFRKLGIRTQREIEDERNALLKLL